MFDSRFKSLMDLQKAFPTEQDCINYLEGMRWQGKVVSPFDPTSKVYKCKDKKTRPILDGFRKNNVNYWAFREIRSIIPHS